VGESVAALPVAWVVVPLAESVAGHWVAAGLEAESVAAEAAGSCDPSSSVGATLACSTRSGLSPSSEDAGGSCLWSR
jgi:hypothetical protein